MGASSLQVNIFIGSGVDEYPIGFNVCISVPCPVEFERMVFVLRRQRLPNKQKAD